MKKKLLVGFTAGLFIASISISANATLVGFVNNPSSNSDDWITAVNSAGGVINSNIDFEGMGTGNINSTFYQLTDGAVLTPSGGFNGVKFGAGPGQGNTSSPPVNHGEGLHAASNYLEGGSAQWSLTVTFDDVISGFGLNVIDYFGASSWERLTLEAFTGVNGTGTSLGTFAAQNNNYQANYIYFMGLLSDSDDIRSVVFTDFNGGTGDIIGVDDILFSRGGGGSQPVPEPATMLLFGTGLAGLAGLRRRQGKK